MQKRKTFLLVHPKISHSKYSFRGVIENECLELEYASAILKEQDYIVYISDMEIEELSFAKILEMYDPDFLYVCGRAKQEPYILQICEEAKEYNREIITIIGGIHAQLCYERMYHKDVDYVLATFNLFHLLEIAKGDRQQIMELDSICYQEDGAWTHNAKMPFDITTLPLPDRCYFYKHPDRYQYLELPHIAHVRTAYSCPYECKFCLRNHMNHGTYTRRDIESVVDEIVQIQSDNIYIVDDDFLVDARRLKRFVELIRERDIHKKFVCFGRADFIAKHPDIMVDLKEIGLYYVLVGLEAIDNKHLHEYNKHSKTNYNIEAIDICHSLGIHMMAMFILDLDYESVDFRRLYRWITIHDLKHVAVSIFTPEFGLETYDTYKSRILTNDITKYDYMHVVAEPEKMSVQGYYAAYYFLVVRLFLKAKRDGIYDSFMDYDSYIRYFLKQIGKRKK